MYFSVSQLLFCIIKYLLLIITECPFEFNKTEILLFYTPQAFYCFSIIYHPFHYQTTSDMTHKITAPIPLFLTLRTYDVLPPGNAKKDSRITDCLIRFRYFSDKNCLQLFFQSIRFYIIYNSYQKRDYTDRNSYCQACQWQV